VPVATEWEYRRVRALASAAVEGGGDMRGLAESRWAEKIAEAGATGWELVSETLSSGGSDGSWWVELSGTLKRPGKPL
jgi:hypothetical protein